MRVVFLRANRLLVLIAFMVVLTCVFAGTITIDAVTSPAAGTYWKNGSHDIVFKVYAEDVNGAEGQADLNVEIYYSISQGAFENLIDDYNLINTDYCGNTNNFNVSGGVECTIPWEMNISSDGNYYVDIKAYTHRQGTLTGDEGTASSDSFYVDNTAPTKVSNLTSTSHTLNTWSTSNDIVFTWEAASDPNLDGYSVLCDTSATTEPDETKDIEGTETTYTCSGVADSDNIYFHIKAVDKAGNWGDTNHLGPFKVDTTPPESEATIASEYYGPNTWDASNTIKGTASDATSGIASVTITIQRDSDNNYWDGDSWEVDPTPLPTTYEKGTWTYTLERTNLTDGVTYTVTPTAIDNAGNNAEGTADSFTYDASAPVTPTLTLKDSSSGSESYTNSRDVNVYIGNDSNVAKWCIKENSTNPNYNDSCFVDSEPTSFELSSGDGEKTVYVWVQDAAGNVSERASDSIILDTEDPNVEITSPNDGSYLKEITKVEGTASDDTAGIDKVEILIKYKDGGTTYYLNDDKDGWDDEENWITASGTTDWEVTGISADFKSGKEYTIKARATDKAGNTDDTSISVNITGEISVTIDVPAYVKAGSVDIKIKASKRLENAYVDIQKGNGEWVEIDGPRDSSEFVVDYEFTEGDDGVWRIRVRADNLINEVTKSFEVDTKAPEITWINPKPGETISGIYTLKVKTDEPAEIKIPQVVFYYDSTKIAEVTQASEQNIYWVANWDTGKVDAGSYTLKAVAEDKAGNKGEATISIAVVKEEEKPAEQEDKNKSSESIGSAEQELNDASKLLNGIQQQGLQLSVETLGLYNEANTLLGQARALYEAGEYAKALEKSNSALDKLNEFVGRISLEEVRSEKKGISMEDVVSIMKAYGFSEDAINEAGSLIASVSAEKTIKVLKLKDGNTEHYYVKVSISFVNHTGMGSLNVIEFVPKSLAESSAELIAEMPFEVLEEDPVLLFRLQNIEAKQKVTIEYSLKEPLSKEDYNEMQTKNAFEILPFAIVKPETELKPVLLNIFSALAIAFAIVLIVIIIVFAILYKFYPKKYEEEKTALMRAIEGLEPKRGFSLPKFGFGGKKPELKKPGRWAYKGK